MTSELKAAILAILERCICNEEHLANDTGNLPIINELLQIIEAQAAALESTVNYLNWNGDNLTGDDIIGDGKMTAKYKRQLSKIENAFAETTARLKKLAGGD